MARRPFIASSANVRLKAVRRLARAPADDVVVAEGGRAVRSAISAGVRVRELYVAPELYLGPADAPLVAEAERGGAQVVEVAATAFRTVARHARPDGLLALVERPCAGLEALVRLPSRPFVLVAAGIERPGNLGTIVRTACAAGADAVIVADPCTDVFQRDVVRGSVGTIFRLPVASAPCDRAIGWLRGRGIRIVVTSPAAETAYWQARYCGALAVVLGGERYGLPDAWLQAADECVAVPMPGPADSLNVAVAAGIVLFEAARRRGEATPLPPARSRAGAGSASGQPSAPG